MNVCEIVRERKKNALRKNERMGITTNEKEMANKIAAFVFF